MMGMEKITRIKIIGLCLSITGVVILQVFRTRAVANGPTLIGDAGILMAALLFAAMTAFSKKFNPGASSIVVNSIGYIGGALLFLPVGAWYWTRTDFHQFSAAAWGGIVYMAAFSSVVCYLIYYWVLERITASRIAAFSYLQPFFATLMAVYALGEQLTLPAVASGIVILAGVVLTERFA
jgi:drug/metabolite transporter (DMT)-like permease